MIPSDAVKHMLAQHEQLRGLMTTLEQILSEPHLRADLLRAALGKLSRAMREHIRDEEDYIPPFLRDLGRPGHDAEQELMADHRSEHLALVRGIETAFQSGLVTPDEVLQVVGCLRDLRRHMTREESEVLHEGLINDAPVTDGMAG